MPWPTDKDERERLIRDLGMAIDADMTDALLYGIGAKLNGKHVPYGTLFEVKVGEYAGFDIVEDAPAQPADPTVITLDPSEYRRIK